MAYPKQAATFGATSRLDPSRHIPGWQQSPWRPWLLPPCPFPAWQSKRSPLASAAWSPPGLPVYLFYLMVLANFHFNFFFFFVLFILM